MKQENIKLSSEQLAELAHVDIRTVDPSNLVDIKDIVIKTDLPVRERVHDYIRQIKNPYCYTSHGVVVKLSFSGEKTLEECLETCIVMET